MRSCAERTSAAALAPGAALAWAALLACSAASPETEVKEALARIGAFELAPGGAVPARLERVRFSDVVVSMSGPRALVLAVVDADGRVGPGSNGPALAYVGREALQMERCARAGWCLAPGALGSLEGVLVALRDVPRETGARVLAWQVRVERSTATAGEDYEVRGLRLRTLRTLRGGEDGWRVNAAP